jgi:hypothetical protein
MAVSRIGLRDGILRMRGGLTDLASLRLVGFPGMMALVSFGATPEETVA